MIDTTPASKLKLQPPLGSGAIWRCQHRIGGVIRDPMGTGMWAKPVCNTDVFCFAPRKPMSKNYPRCSAPSQCHEGRGFGVRDYGNRMGIPTVNGAVYFDRRYLGNPLVYCGNVGMIPVGMEEKRSNQMT